MRTENIICTVCPVGCNISIRGEGEQIESIQGHTCKRGEEYAQNEFINPVRILTSTVKVEDGKTPLVPVRSSKPISKKLIFECMEEIRKLKVKAPVQQYNVLIANILGTGVDIISTCSVE